MSLELIRFFKKNAPQLNVARDLFRAVCSSLTLIGIISWLVRLQLQAPARPCRLTGQQR